MTQPCRSEIGSPVTYHQSQSPVTHHFHTKPSRAGNTRPVGPPTSGPVGLLSGRRSARRSLSFTAASTSGLRQRQHVLHCEGRRWPAGVSVEKSGEAVGADLGGVEAARGEEVRSETHLQDRQFAIAIAESCEDEENKWR